MVKSPNWNAHLLHWSRRMSGDLAALAVKAVLHPSCHVFGHSWPQILAGHHPFCRTRTWMCHRMQAVECMSAKSNRQQYSTAADGRHPHAGFVCFHSEPWRFFQHHTIFACSLSCNQLTWFDVYTVLRAHMELTAHCTLWKHNINNPSTGCLFILILCPRKFN